MPKPPSRSMRVEGRDAEGAGRARGGIMRSATSLQRPAVRAAPVEDVQRRGPAPTESGYRLVVEVEDSAQPRGGQWMDGPRNYGAL